VAQHLDPTRTSHLRAILARRSPLPVRTIADQETLEPGVLYVVPANQHIAISDHHLSIEPDGPDRPKPSIDLLFRSAAQAFGEGLIAVVLSGLGSDGAAGARHVRAGGGTVVIQNPRTAQYPSMPASLAPTTVDIVAEAGAMGPLLHDLLVGAHVLTGPRDSRQVGSFLAALRTQRGIDFSHYKSGTIQRRLNRRMVATRTHNLEEYRLYLEQHPHEVDRLINAFLINVTEFFRDADVFADLREHVLPEVLAWGRAHDRTLRVWSAGCATGEEAYSLAILVADALGDELDAWAVRIFATDLDKEAVDFARRGVYPAATVAGVPEALRARYLVEEAGTYTATKTVRQLLVFGEHDLAQRPPFPHVDLCLCRNVLIYFTPELQRHVLEAFAFALRDGGYLVLGKAETTSPAEGYFTTVDQGLRVYRRAGKRALLPPRPDHHLLVRVPAAHTVPSLPAAQELARMRRETQEALQAQLAAEEVLLRLPVGVAVVDRHYDLQRLNNTARRLLGIHTPALGEDLVHLAQGIASQKLRAAIDAALGGQVRTLEDIATEAVTPSETRYLQITCQPHQAADGDVLVVLTILDVTAPIQERANWEQERAETGRLRGQVEQLAAANQQLLAANEELATSEALLRRANEEYILGSEEIQAATEEVETLNEELQATNEELETLNEEQQATVEELETTNDELRARSLEAQGLAVTVDGQRSRLAAVLDSMGEAVVVVDSEEGAIFINAVFEQMMGAVGLDFVAADAQGQPLPAGEAPQARLRRGERFEMAFTWAAAGGPRRRFEARGWPIDADSPHQDAVLVLREITEPTPGPDDR
jgi:two-component system CheB/CheR fusion protein